MSARKAHKDQQVPIRSNKRVRFRDDQTGEEREEANRQTNREVNMPKRRREAPTQQDRESGAKVAAESLGISC